MVNGIIGKKLGMTQMFREDGSVTPVTVIKAGPCIVVQKKTVNTDGYDAVQLGLVEEKPPRHVNKPTEGHFKRRLACFARCASTPEKRRQASATRCWSIFSMRTTSLK